ncbi:DNA translocase FtsK 4TM domain-containing protein [Aestuariibacter sp. AA17]|uniref:DNA translocase FtsK n=1 Tax=Fluctibacter corallii TaxID=2984329 RepID=A0ABT3A623_9ALTE|nr:DNA translocase FtsK 4TM domain-containing protein [Aestuariibacter sp. AA17]MCV2884075.1 DNA translocase FtsK 4TM domain-containing protein [Aestuariibacter sp. AA17]
MARLSGLQRVMEAGLILTSVFAFFLLLALASFHPADPGWSQAGLQGNIHNWVGPVGAWFADILLNTFGRVAFAIPFICAFIGWFLFHQVKHIVEFDYTTIGLRIIGGLLVLLGVSGLFSINADDIFTFSAGGIIGDLISAGLVPYFSVAGTVLLLLCFLCTGFTLLTGISWLTIVDTLGAFTIKGALAAYRAPQRLQHASIPRLSFTPNSNRSLEGEGREPSPSDDEIHITRFQAAPEASSVEDSQEQAVSDKSKRASASMYERDHVGDELHNTEPAYDTSTDSNLGNTNDDDHRVEPSIPEEVFTNAPEESKGDKKDYAMSIEELREKVRQKKASTGAPEPVTIDDGEPLAPLPSFELLDRPDRSKNPISQEELDVLSRLLEDKLADFNIEANVVGVYPGPVITRFELDLAPGVKVSKITGLSKDLARAMSATSVRVVEVIPGKSYIGLELPNKHRETVRLSEVIACDAFQSSSSALTMVLGADIAGNPVVVDLAKMPHLLVAGTTGSGKSVGVNVMILSLLYKSKPEDVRMIMIDPKMLELSVYEGIPHLLAEVVTDMKEAANALRWCVGEMERRYRLMSALGVRNLKGYNAKVTQAIADGTPIKDPLWRAEESMDSEAPDLEKLPSIVVVVDEFADMMMIVGKKVEELIARIAQKARAAGIHLVLATQRPSVDVVTGLIKANIPTRIAFQVSTKIDSRTILDQQGAETLLGMGDMLYLPPGTGVPTRVHGAFVDDHEVHAVVADWKRRGEPEYIDEILNGEASAEVLLPGEQPEGGDQEFDAFYDEAVSFVTETRRASVSGVQRKFRIGYNRAARLVEQMEQSGVVSAPGHNGNREVLAPPPPKE